MPNKIPSEYELKKRLLLRTLSQRFSHEQLSILSSNLGVDFDSLREEGKAAKARELLAYAERRGRMDELLALVDQARPDLDLPLALTQLDLVTMTIRGEPDRYVNFDFGKHLHDACDFLPAPISASAIDVDSLTVELAGLRQRLDEVQDGVVPPDQLKARVEDMVKTATRAIDQSEDLKARLLLPPQDLTDVRLLPSNALERLEEYRADENLAFLLIGAFVGAILGILSNWATTVPFVITRFSAVLMGLLAALAAASAWWAWRLRQRANKVKERMFSPRHAAEAESTD